MSDEEFNREDRKQTLIDELCWISLRIKALKAEAETRRSELHLLMSQDGDGAIRSGWGRAKFTDNRYVEVLDKDKVLEVFGLENVLKHFKPTMALIEACKREGKEIKGVVNVGVSRDLKVSQKEDKEAKKRKSEFIESSRADFEAQLEEYRKNLRRQ